MHYLLQMQLISRSSAKQNVNHTFLPVRRYASVGIYYSISVSLCVTHMLCIKMAKHFVKILLATDSPIILLFHHWGSLLNSDGFNDEYKGG